MQLAEVKVFGHFSIVK